MANTDADLSVIGVSGLKQFNGFVLEDLLPEMHGLRGVRLYREMQDNDSTIGAVLYTIKSLARNAPYTLEPAKRGGKEAEFVQQCMDDMSTPFSDFITEAFSFMTYGWAYFEKVYKIRGGDTDDPTRRSKYSDGRIGWRKFALRSQDSLLRWEFDEDGGLRGLWQLSPPYYKLNFLPIEKCLLFRTEMQKGSPEGRSFLRSITVDYFYKKRIQETEAVGIARDMTGLVTMEVPVEMLSANPPPGILGLRNQLERMLASIHRDQREFAMIPPEIGPDGAPTGYKLKLLNSGGRRQLNINETIMRYSKQMAMVMMGEMMYMGVDKAGSYAMSKTKANMMGMAIGTLLQSVASTFNRFAIPELLKLNGMNILRAPKLVFGKVFAPDPEEIATYITKLAAVNAIETGKELSDELLRLGELPISTRPIDNELTPNLNPNGFTQQPSSKEPSDGSPKKDAPSADKKPSEDNDDSDN